MTVAALIHALPPTVRRGFNRKEAASYIGISVGTFDKLVRDGGMPRPLQLMGRKVWDRAALDRMIDRHSDGADKGDLPNEIDRLLGLL